jgi:hypothetical protein
MAVVLFVSQAVLEAWSEQGRIAFAGQAMTVREGAGAGRCYALEPAVRFLKVVGADRDPHGLVAKVKTDAQLRALGAERLGDSVLLGEVGYEVQPGYLAQPPPGGSEPANAAQELGRLLENLR